MMALKTRTFFKDFILTEFLNDLNDVSVVVAVTLEEQPEK